MSSSRPTLLSMALAPAAGLFLRLRVVWPYLWRYLGQVLRWWVRARETTNLTYPITPLSRLQLAALTAQVTGATPERVLELFDELEQDGALRAHIVQLASAPERRHKSDPHMPYGRRLVWYALVRLLRPQQVVETGVEKGLGSVVICAALLRNRAEGHPGQYIGTDINPRAGYLLAGPYAEVGRIAADRSRGSVHQRQRPQRRLRSERIPLHRPTAKPPGGGGGRQRPCHRPPLSVCAQHRPPLPLHQRSGRGALVSGRGRRGGVVSFTHFRQ